MDGDSIIIRNVGKRKRTNLPFFVRSVLRMRILFPFSLADALKWGKNAERASHSPVIRHGTRRAHDKWE